ncbi:argininosuccinate lyase [Alkalimonas collagenimarina]|uniref:Argininosuccinate lyase n=1 Tax=Alkalimonas collagenimarina TaxID=400390 RepID=A0ABT9H1T7_9GAMM|nr:argininosuccinate lyase [Alkalimonas collagenimarina]MDP4537282.1 argininosuccinate lyase [Alkalimonas collagenimarina]
MAMWGGRFTEASLAEFKAFNDSIGFDYQLAQQDIAASKVWAAGLAEANLITAQEAEQLQQALQKLALKLEQDPTLPVDSGEEDIHSWVEVQLTEQLGAVARKLHTGRSRNDLVATDLRLWARDAAQAVRHSLLASVQALINFAEAAGDAVMPGYTHLQRAQPVMVAHWALAYVEMLKRDVGRLDDAVARLNVCPLGAGALAGTGVPVDRNWLAIELGFDSAAANSLDAVSDRDFVVELSAAASLCMTHVSRLSEDVVFFCSGEAGFFKLGDAISSGSSLMPQKKNPDVFELLRGKSGRILGQLVAILHVLKGLPLAYNKDMQEDKQGFFDLMQQWQQSLQVLATVLPHLTVKVDVCRQAAELGYSNATDLADYLVGKGIPFRDAHHLSGQLVLTASEQQIPLEQLTLSQMQQVSPVIRDDVYPALTLEAGMARRNALGGTSPAQVMSALTHAKVWLAAQQ